MHRHLGYRYEGLPVLVIWAVFFVVVLIFDAEARRLHAWAFLLLMALVSALSAACEYILYRAHNRAKPRPD